MIPYKHNSVHHTRTNIHTSLGLIFSVDIGLSQTKNSFGKGNYLIFRGNTGCCIFVVKRTDPYLERRMSSLAGVRLQPVTSNADKCLISIATLFTYIMLVFTLIWLFGKHLRWEYSMNKHSAFPHPFPITICSLRGCSAHFTKFLSGNELKHMRGFNSTDIPSFPVFSYRDLEIICENRDAQTMPLCWLTP